MLAPSVQFLSMLASTNSALYLFLNLPGLTLLALYQARRPKFLFSTAKTTSHLREYYTNLIIIGTNCGNLAPSLRNILSFTSAQSKPRLPSVSTPHPSLLWELSYFPERATTIKQWLRFNCRSKCRQTSISWVYRTTAACFSPEIRLKLAAGPFTLAAVRPPSISVLWALHLRRLR